VALVALGSRSRIPSANCTTSIKGQLANNACQGLCHIVQSLSRPVLSCLGLYPPNEHPVDGRVDQDTFHPYFAANAPRQTFPAFFNVCQRTDAEAQTAHHRDSYSSIIFGEPGAGLSLKIAVGCPYRHSSLLQLPMLSRMNFFAAILAPLSLAFSLATLTPPNALADEASKGAGGEISTTPPSVTPAVTPAVTPGQARRALSILQDEKKRTELEETLAAIAQATGSTPATAPVELPAQSSARGREGVSKGEQVPLPIQLTKNGLIAQVFDLIGKRLDAVGDQLRLTARMFLEVKTVGARWQ
jgi:hypothetical protein